ncbi:MAG: aconitase family protein, partial [Bacteroidales bacterium]|nr:aconitase family protein [Bacteroidales bacterium]
KDLSLFIIGMIKSDGANYMSIEYHGEGLKTLGISERMTLANLASEMGAKNAVFPPDEVLAEFIGTGIQSGIWADENATYHTEINIDLDLVPPLIAAPHQVDNVKALSELEGLKLDQGLIGTCTNGRIEDLREAHKVLKGKKVKEGFQLLVIPASQKIYLQAIEEGIVKDLIEAGANLLAPSCGPCLGTGQGIPADGFRVISTANRNFLGRMGNKEAEIYLASPATVAISAIEGKISDPRGPGYKDKFEFGKSDQSSDGSVINDNRLINEVWNYSDIDNMNTDQMFAGNLTYNVLSSDAEAIMPHLFKGFDENFCDKVADGQIIIAGDNFGCGSSREHPAVGLAHAGIKAVIVKSVNRIFFRSAINQGLPLIVLPEVVDAYNAGDKVDIDFIEGTVHTGNLTISFEPLPDKLNDIIKKKGLVNWISGK